MVNGLRASDTCGLNKGWGSKFCVNSRIQQKTPEEGRKIMNEYDNKYKDNSPKTLNDKNHQASSQKFWQLTWILSLEKVECG